MRNDSQTIGDRVIVNPRFKLATLRDREGRIREHVRLSMEVCGCGYSYARPGVGYAGKQAGTASGAASFTRPSRTCRKLRGSKRTADRTPGE